MFIFAHGIVGCNLSILSSVHTHSARQIIAIQKSKSELRCFVLVGTHLETSVLVDKIEGKVKVYRLSRRVTATEQETSCKKDEGQAS